MLSYHGITFFKNSIIVGANVAMRKIFRFFGWYKNLKTFLSKKKLMQMFAYVFQPSLVRKMPTKSRHTLIFNLICFLEYLFWLTSRPSLQLAAKSSLNIAVTARSAVISCGDRKRKGCRLLERLAYWKCELVH